MRALDSEFENEEKTRQIYNFLNEFLFRLDDIVPALWALGQPNGPKSRRVRVSEIEFCVAVRQVEVSSEMDPPGLLHDEPCHRLAAAVCEEKPSSMTLGSRGEKSFLLSQYFYTLYNEMIFQYFH